MESIQLNIGFVWASFSCLKWILSLCSPYFHVWAFIRMIGMASERLQKCFALSVNNIAPVASSWCEEKKTKVVKTYWCLFEYNLDPNEKCHMPPPSLMSWLVSLSYWKECAFYLVYFFILMQWSHTNSSLCWAMRDTQQFCALKTRPSKFNVQFFHRSHWHKRKSSSISDPVFQRYHNKTELNWECQPIHLHWRYSIIIMYPCSGKSSNFFFASWKSIL